MSIVDKLAQYRNIACFLLFFSPALVAENWQASLSEQICQRWQEISAADQPCELSFPGLSQQFQLPFCEQPINHQLSRALTPGRNGIELSCHQPRWQQNLAIQLHIHQEIVILANPVGIGQPLSAEDISLIRHDLSNLGRDFYSDPELVIGQQLKRNVRTGTILTSALLEAPQLIGRGDLVSILIKRPTLTLETQGTALENGKLGDTIRIRNNQSNNIVVGRVIKAGQVEIN